MTFKRAVVLLFFFTLLACEPQSTPTFFLPPTQPAEIVPTQVIVRVPTSTITIVPTLTSVIATPTPCTNGLTFVRDITVPDNTPFSPGQSIDKQWLVTNSGTCDWDSSYRLKLINGPAMGAPTEQALFPARGGMQATIRIIFTAPADTGTYVSTWQAFGANGEAFGDTVYIQIVVQ
ncbi:MAG TPA: NBR1-Ig-like domain-containing protein [Anaerolineales bacterium]|nr:NBR1-Ig-like domain-containing protein [Anaerolineales bacterium]